MGDEPGDSRKIILGELGDIESGSASSSGTGPWRSRKCRCRPGRCSGYRRHAMTTALKFRNIDASRLAHPYGTPPNCWREWLPAHASWPPIQNRRTRASEVRVLVTRSGLSKPEFAERIGTSRSRLSTYMSGKVVPSATLMVRMQRLAHHASERTSRSTAS
jgi:hypothetical protein